MELPWVRPRDLDQPWQQNLLDSIRNDGLRYPLMVYGHFPKAEICEWHKCDWNAERDEAFYVHQGTNRFHCLDRLGYGTFPAVLSLNKGLEPEFDSKRLPPPQELEKREKPLYFLIFDYIAPLWRIL